MSGSQPPVDSRNHRIANVLLQSGQSVPDWMVQLQKPSRLKRKQMGKAQHKELSVGSKGENVGRAMAVKKKYVSFGHFICMCADAIKSDMIAGSKRRKTRRDSDEQD
jgi:hypothetical protein